MGEPAGLGACGINRREDQGLSAGSQKRVRVATRRQSELTARPDAGMAEGCKARRGGRRGPLSRTRIDAGLVEGDGGAESAVVGVGAKQPLTVSARETGRERQCDRAQQQLLLIPTEPEPEGAAAASGSVGINTAQVTSEVEALI